MLEQVWLVFKVFLGLLFSYIFLYKWSFCNWAFKVLPFFFLLKIYITMNDFGALIHQQAPFRHLNRITDDFQEWLLAPPLRRNHSPCSFIPLPFHFANWVLLSLLSLVQNEIGRLVWSWDRIKKRGGGRKPEKPNRSRFDWVLTRSHSSSNVKSATVPHALFTLSPLPCTFKILGLVTMGTWTKTQSCLDNYYKTHLLQIGNA